jgi:hypothetical protein
MGENKSFFDLLLEKDQKKLESGQTTIEVSESGVAIVRMGQK